MKVSMIFYFIGVATLFFIVAMQVINPEAGKFFVPLPVVVSAFVGLLFCGMFVGRAVEPLFQLYQYKLFGQKDWNMISASKYQTSLAKAEKMRELFVGTLYLSCWALLPLIFFYAAYVCAKKHVDNLPPTDYSF